VLYWRRLKEVAETITDTEVRLNLPGQDTAKGRKFNIEGVVDIVREEGRTVMYDLKTHDPDYIKQNLAEYERQLNVYAHIWKNLRKQDLNETAVIATRLPDSLDAAWANQDRDPSLLEDELNRWDPSYRSRLTRNTSKTRSKRSGPRWTASKMGFTPHHCPVNWTRRKSETKPLPRGCVATAMHDSHAARLGNT